MTIGLLSFAPPAHAGNERGSKNCVGRGTIVVDVTYQPRFGMRLVAKSAGPPTSPTWGIGVKKDITTPSNFVTTRTYVTPIREGRWAAYSRGYDSLPDVRAYCSRNYRAANASRPTPSARQGPNRVSLGRKFCPVGWKVRILADSYGVVNVGWKSRPHRGFNFVQLRQGPVVNTVYTNDRKIYDANIWTDHQDGFLGYGLKCYKSG